VLPVGVSSLDVIANDHADRLAKEAAASVQLSRAHTSHYIYYSTLVGRIQRRLATILLYLPRRETIRKEKEPKPPTVKRDQLLLNTSHTIVCSRSRYSCRKCQNNFHTSDPSFNTWLQTSCTPLVPAVVHDVPRPITNHNVVHIGNSVTHVSHRLFIYRGLIYCESCGARAGASQIRKLSKICVPAEPESAGQKVVQCIRAGRRPAGVTIWPDEL
jgi:hypothetical protein